MEKKKIAGLAYCKPQPTSGLASRRPMTCLPAMPEDERRASADETCENKSCKQNFLVLLTISLILGDMFQSGKMDAHD